MLLRTLGGLRLEGAEFSRPKPLLLLAYLAIEGRKDRRHLAELFWMGAPHPRNNLGTALAQLRKGAPGTIESDRGRVWATVRCDAQDLLTAVEEGEVDRARALYLGPFLTGVDLPELGVELEEWVYGTREVLAGAARKALLVLAGKSAREGAFREGARHAEAARLVPGAGQSSPEELAVTHALLVAGESARAADVGREAAEYGQALDLTVEGARARLRGPDPRRAIPNNLPPDVSVFVGRHQERRDLAERLARDECRLLTLVGAGGVGKSRLALSHARDALADERHRDGVFLVALESLTHPDQVPARIADALGRTLRGDDDPLAQLGRHLAGERTLLVLDNFEHLAEGAGLLAALVRSCPGLTLLVTSRERLNLEEEWAVPVAGLGLPAAGAALEEAEDAEAVRMFVQRARRVDPRFALTGENLSAVVEVCRLVEGLPLGLELAAAWVRALPVEEIAREARGDLDFLASPARNVDARHRSLRAVFESSWRRLPEGEREVFAKLSVFRGGFARAAAGEVAGATLPGLASLVDRSLLRRAEGGRYHLHELLRQFAADKLEADGAGRREAEAAHARHYAALLQGLEGDLLGAEQSGALNTIAVELGNVWACWAWAVEHADVACLSMAAQGLLEFCDTRGQARRGSDAFRRAVATVRELAGAAGGEELRLLLARLLVRLGRLGVRIDMPDGPDAPLSLFSESEALLRPLQSRFPSEYSAVLMWRGTEYFQIGDLARGMEDFSASERSAVEAGDDHELGGALLAAGQMLERKGEYLAAEPYLERSVEAFTGTGDRRYRSYAVNNWGRAAYGMGKYGQAQRLLDDALATREELDDVIGVIFSLADLGNLARMRGRYDVARSRLQRGLELAKKVGFSEGAIICLDGLGRLALSLGDLDQARRKHSAGLEMASTAHLRHFRPAALKDLAVVALLEDDLEAAHRLLYESLELGRRTGSVRDEASARRLLGSLNATEHPADPAGAREHFRAALEIALRTGAAPLALDVLADWAAAEGGDRALAWLALVARDPRSEHESRERAMRLLAERARAGSDDIEEGGRHPDLWEAVAGLLTQTPDASKRENGPDPTGQPA